MAATVKFKIINPKSYFFGKTFEYLKPMMESGKAEGVILALGNSSMCFKYDEVEKVG